MDTLDDIIKLKPDLVVIDLMLSEIDGIGVIEKCRELIEPDKNSSIYCINNARK